MIVSPPSDVAFLASRMDPDHRVLNLLREDIYRLGQELEQPVWVAECSGQEWEERTDEDIQISCLKYVLEIPEFICILDGSYGTPWNVAQLCVLELEILAAALAAKPFHFFLLDPYQPDPRTETLLNAVRLAKPDLRDTRPVSSEEILMKLRSRLAGRPRARRQVRSVIGDEPPVRVVQARWSAIDPMSAPVDLTIASHSLYGELEGRSGEEREREVLRPILNDTLDTGWVLFVLASRRSLTMTFKNKALAAWFGIPDESLTFEALVRAMPIGLKRLTAVVDNVVDFSDLLREWENGSETALCRWLSYFLRLPLDSFNTPYGAMLLEELREAAVPLGCFAETSIKKLTEDLRLPPDAQVLPHKSGLMLVRGASALS